ncbi:MAG: ABC transporter substrate-binding protein [Lachnospiraceae bacterium]|nr:ABC transporter substrate-binding protein [Lachnospiraceae bacterium]
MRKKVLALLLCAAMTASVLTGCGGKADNAGSTAGGESGTTQEASGTEQAEPAGESAVQETAQVEPSTTLSDKEVNIGYGTVIDSLTPFRANVANDSPYFVQLYETLGVLDGNREMQPYAAKSWETSDDGFTYTIEIWDTISDSAGNKITAADIVWFIEESKARALKPIFAKVDSVTQTGDYTLELKLTDNKFGTIDTILMDVFVVSKAAFEASSDEFGSSVVSTSPYVCTEFTASASISFERRDDYWQDIENLPECVRPLQKKVNYKLITEASQLGIALETGEIDMAINIATETGSQFVDNDNFVVDLSDGRSGWQVFFSGADTSPAANDVKLRQAICYGIDAQGLIAGLCSGYATQMWDVCSPFTVGFNENWKNESYYDYDLEKAKALLAESDYNGETLTILSSSSATASRLAQLLQNYLVAMDIKCEVNSVDMALYTSIRLDGTQYDMVINTVGEYSLADNWSIRFDPAAYATGDATSRHDYDLAELIYKTWTLDGFTEENINEVHEYLKESAIAYGLVNPQLFTVWSKASGLSKAVTGARRNYIVPSACQFE